MKMQSLRGILMENLSELMQKNLRKKPLSYALHRKFTAFSFQYTINYAGFSFLSQMEKNITGYLSWRIWKQKF